MAASLQKTFVAIEEFAARTPILGWCLSIFLLTWGERDAAKASVAKCNNSVASYFVGVAFIHLSRDFEGLIAALLFAGVAGAIGGVVGHVIEATTADRILTPTPTRRAKMASYLSSDVAVSVIIGITAGLAVEVANALLLKALSESTANLIAVEICAALTVYHSMGAEEEAAIGEKKDR